MIRCTQCGARKDRATDPCIYCGAAGDRQSKSNPNFKGIVLLLSILTIAMVAVCISLLFGFASGEEDAKDLVDTMVVAINENDAEKLSSVFPEIYIDGINLIPNFAAGYLDEYRHELETEYGEDFHVSADILSVEDADDYEEDLMDILYEEAQIEIQKSKFVEIELTVNGSKKAETTTIILNLIKIDGAWYINVLDSFFI